MATFRFGVLVVAVASAVSQPRPESSAVGQAFAAFWAAASPAQASVAVKAVLGSGVSFDDAYARLAAGRLYRADVPRGVQKLVRRSGATEFPYTIDVPASYDPAKRYQVRVQLHGGVGRPEPTMRGDGSIGALAGAEQLYVLPQAWAGAEWWATPQDENLPAILDSVKRTYNVDENRVVLAGVSDGGTGAFYVAMRDTTPYASFVPLNGFILVLRSAGLGLAGALFPNNMRNKPFFAVNGGNDPLYPAARVTPYMEHFRAGGLEVEYVPVPEAGHNTAWWPQLKDRAEAFAHEHPREPHPSAITWRTDSTTSRNRAHWLVIDRLTPSAAGSALPDINDMPGGTDPGFGARTDGMTVTQVLNGSNAAGFGLEAGDLITAVNGRPLPAALDFTDYLGLFEGGATLDLTVSRGARAVSLGGIYRPTPMARVTPIFPSGVASGRVDVIREGNSFRAVTRGVGAFTLLLSPDVVDFTKPVTVIADGRTVFEGRVQKSLDTLLTWAARDNDRTMLYGAALPVSLADR
jgi:PDZ domain